MTTTESQPLPRVLLLDDEPQVLSALAQVMRRRFDITTASNGLDALELLAGEEFEVVVSDMRMPAMNGAEFLRRARAQSPTTVRILLTGFADVDSAIAAVNEGNIFRYLSKPCPPPELIAAIATAVEKHREEKRERDFVTGEHQRISDKLMRAGKMASVASLANGAGEELRRLAHAHAAVLDRAVSSAVAGQPLHMQEVDELRRVEASLSRAAGYLVDFKSVDVDERREIALEALAAHSADAVAVLPGAELVTLDITVQPHTPRIMGRSSELELAVFNVVSNAVEAIRRKGSMGVVAIRVRYDYDIDHVVLEVEDDGIGIHPEARPFIMRPCFSAFGSERVGLGLSVAKEAVEANGGTISFESRFGHGSLFRISLPALVNPDADTLEAPRQAMAHPMSA